MKRILLFVVFTIMFSTVSYYILAQEENKPDILQKTALIIIDIQNFYFPGGALPLYQPEDAAQNAQKLLNVFREKNKPVIHVKHIAKTGSEIHELVAPLEEEKVISKNKANAFIDTDLFEYLKNLHIENVVLCGMQTHMCLEAATRAASDFGFNCTVIGDACASRDLMYGDITVNAENVHYSTLNTLNGTYAKIETTKEFLKRIK